MKIFKSLQFIQLSHNIQITEIFENFRQLSENSNFFKMSDLLRLPRILGFF
jgi:hypothetical protein